MPSGQTYNQYTQCTQPSDYNGVFLGGAAFWTGIVASIALLFVDPGAAIFAAILTGIGYCRWWLYQRLVCLGQPNACAVGLVLRIDTQQNQAGLGKFDTDYTVDLLLPPNPLLGDQDYLNKMNTPAVYWPDVLMQDQTSPTAPSDPTYVQMRQTYTPNQPFGFTGETVTGYDLQSHDGTSVMSAAQTQALNLLTPDDWQSGNFYLPGAQINDGNGGLETAIVQGLSGSNPPSWPNPDLRNWQSSLGQTTTDGYISWRYDGPVPVVGILEIEFEGAGVWNLYQVLLAFSPIAAGMAAICLIPVIGWIACLIASLVLAALVAGIGALAGLTDNSAEGDVNSQVGALQPGVDVLLVSGTWVWDGGHIPNGWNELHPVLFAQKVASVDRADLLAGTPWQSLPQFGPANLSNTLSQMCGLVAIAQDPSTQTEQQLPQNGWTLHPAVDGCAPPAQAPVLQ
jgi:hypothetical protein